MGFHFQDTLLPQQYDALRAGAKELHAAGEGLFLTSVNDKRTIEVARAELGSALLALFRPVFSAHDLVPNDGGHWWSGEAWFNRLWPFMAGMQADVYQFVNEWWIGNTASVEDCKRYGQFYIELMNACHAHGVICTCGDFEVGTPGYPTLASEKHQIPALSDMLSTCERLGMYLNYHCYSPEGVGATDMLAQSELYTMRWKTLTKDHPNLKVLGGEIANAGKDLTGRQGVFRGQQSLTLMKQYADAVRGDPNWVSGAWWWIGNPDTHRSAEADWSKDDFSPIVPQVYDFLATR